MPRIYTSANDPIDFCERHFPSEEEAWEEYGDVGDGPDGRGNCFSHDSGHPTYNEYDYRCHVCGKPLTPEDP